MTTTHEFVSADAIQPPHEVRDASKLAALVADMRANGWTGRPLLVRAENGFEGWTGSHRIAAARLVLAQLRAEDCGASFEVPVVILSADLAWDDYRDDDERLDALRETDDEDAIELMQAEVEAN